jgi:hypothetical protein
VLVPAGKQYKAIRAFSRTDPKTGAESTYKVGDVYPGPVDKDYLMSKDGPDGRGPLIAEVAVPSSPAPASDSSKEK